MRTVIKKVVPSNLFKKVEPLGHLGEAMVAQTRLGFPAKGLHIIGVTGTNGKTSTCFMIHRMLHEAGFKVGLMTTVAYGAGLDIKEKAERLTTPSPGTILKRIQELRGKGVEWLVLEVTSHALSQHRVWGLSFDVAVMTNISHEHLDYHGTFANYLAAKRRLFAQTNSNKKGLRIGVINADDEQASVFASAIANPVTYGIDTGEARAKKIVLSADGVTYDAIIGKDSYHIRSKLPGRFNVYNSLAAVCVGRAVGLSKHQIEQGIAALESVQGRMTRIDEGQDFSVIVDYAHTPDSFEKLFKDIKPIVEGKMFVMFGSPGRRDETKRAIQGGLAGQYADEVVITEDDDRDMDSQEIMRQIAAGAIDKGKKLDKDLFIIHDRDKAMEFILGRAKKGDVVLLLGKGHEKDTLRNGPRAAELRHLQQDDNDPERVIRFPWDEIGEAHRILKKVTKKR